MLKLGSVRSDQSQSSTPDQPTNGGPAAFLREDLGDGNTLFSLFKRFLFLRAYEIGRSLAEIVLQYLDKYKRSGLTFSRHIRKKTNSVKVKMNAKCANQYLQLFKKRKSMHP